MSVAINLYDMKTSRRRAATSFEIS